MIGISARLPTRASRIRRVIRRDEECGFSGDEECQCPEGLEPLVREAERMMAGKARMASIESFAALYEPAPYIVTCSYFEPDIT
jgi:hypothetical protein